MLAIAMYRPSRGGHNDEENKNGNRPSKDNGGGGGEVEDLELDIHTEEEVAKEKEEEKVSLIPLPLNSNKNHANQQEDNAQPQQQQKRQPLQEKGQQQQQKGRERLVSLDVFRGLTVALMILVDHAGGFLPAINHSPWNGLTLADVVFPFFLFISGVSLALTYKKIPCKIVASTKALLRASKLLMLGIFLQGGFIHGLNDLTFGVDLKKIRWMGILQRIAIAYLFGATCEIWLKDDGHIGSNFTLLRKYRFQWVAVLVLVTTYLSLLYGLYVPDWEYHIPVDSFLSNETFSVKCGVRGDTGPACNAVGMIDRRVLGVKHLYIKPTYARTKQCSINSPNYGPIPSGAPSWCQAPFDPEGLLSSAMAIVTCIIGLHYGHIIVNIKDHRDRVLHWMIPSTCLIVSGLALNFYGMHVNKPLYTVSYMCITAGIAGFALSGIYILVDMYGYRHGTWVFEWMGKHALMIYVLAASNVLPVVLQGFYWKQPQNNILSLFRIRR